MAQAARLRLRIFEMGISYAGRTYEEGKKIGPIDALRAVYCILRYNLPSAPVHVQFAGYVAVGAVSAGANLLLFLTALSLLLPPAPSALLAFFAAAALNYYLSATLVFRRSRPVWIEMLAYAGVVAGCGAIDLGCTLIALKLGAAAWLAKSIASGLTLVANYTGRRIVVFQSGESRQQADAPFVVAQRARTEVAPDGSATRA